MCGHLGGQSGYRMPGFANAKKNTTPAPQSPSRGVAFLGSGGNTGWQGPGGPTGGQSTQSPVSGMGIGYGADWSGFTPEGFVSTPGQIPMAGALQEKRDQYTARRESEKAARLKSEQDAHLRGLQHIPIQPKIGVSSSALEQKRSSDEDARRRRAAAGASRGRRRRPLESTSSGLIGR